jgi:hypothetical protein
MTTQTFWIGTRDTGIDPAALSQEQYFQDFFQTVCRKKLLKEEEITRIHTGILELFTKEANRYTNDESSSIPVETAQSLLQSITFSMGSYLKTFADVGTQLKILKETEMSALFLLGQKTIEQRCEAARKLLSRLIDGLMRINLIAYQDTIREGLPKFFHDYNVEFAAHENVGDIDYPSFVTITDLLGVEYMEEYLRRLYLENEFLNCFSAADINRLLIAFDREASHMLINLFELVLINALGCKLLEKEARILDIRAQENVWLQDVLSKLSKEAREAQLRQAFSTLVKELALSEELADYVLPELPMLSGRLSHHLDGNTLSHFFLSFENAWQEAYEFMEEGEIMEDYKLRHLIERIENTDVIADKVHLILQEVRSTTDLIELLEECFYDGDYEEVFRLLGKAELHMLEKRILYDAGEIPAEDFEPQTEWQKILWNYLHKS